MNKTLEIFKEICKIYRPSGKEGKIADYVENFAKTRNLQVYRDEYNNVIIKKGVKASPLILQAHLDMVCETEYGSDANMEQNGVIAVEEDGYLKAINTTLGADDGMGVALILSLLDESFAQNLECVFTTQEETTMNGIKNLDTSILQGKNILGLDGTEFGVLEVSSAGFCSIKLTPNQTKRLVAPHKNYRLSISGLQGGHSGEDINKNRYNAIFLMAKLLKGKVVCSLNGGTKLNVIPTSCQAVAQLTPSDIVQLKKDFENYKIANPTEDGMKLEIRECDEKTSKDFSNWVDFICSMDSGVITRDGDFVITSLNIARVDTNSNTLLVSLRSSKVVEEQIQLQKLKELSQNFGFTLEVFDTSPFFEFRDNTEFLKILDKSFFELYHTYPQKKKIHAGLEGGVFAQKIPDANIYVTAPNIYDLHTPKERVEIESVHKTYDWLTKIVKMYNQKG